MNKTDLSSATEEQLLLQRLREGDMGSYETLFHRYYPTFFAFAKGMLKDAGAAEDIIQNVFMKIWIHREALDETMSIKNYIYVLMQMCEGQIRVCNKPFKSTERLENGYRHV